MTAKVIPIVEQRAASRGPVIPAPATGTGGTLNSIPAFATAAPDANLSPMPTLEINATQPWHIAQDGNVAKITRRLAVMNLALRGIDADLVGCMVALPGQLFYSTQPIEALAA